MIQYREFKIEFFSGEFSGRPTVMMSIELSPDPFEDKWYTEEIWLENGITEEKAIEAAKNWIDQFWINQDNQESC